MKTRKNQKDSEPSRSGRSQEWEDREVHRMRAVGMRVVAVAGGEASEPFAEDVSRGI